ncbi:hypothetical protein BJ138DRAFT_1071737 [Hygrophoropsis aurantiaca]|uniref:Uncharacterized protein n=1 Tax=Hygrophoropsis aurantiaca TaxID=72124 RepID=A0ACB7ZZE0_9AGAM|nr:hypothetical protein BJ138DRAFT_1071737 [Hygrophoropsis aurantiaca]
MTPERTYPKQVNEVADHIQQPRLPDLIRRFLYDQIHPDSPISSAQVPLDDCPDFSGNISVFHSAVARFYAPSDLCGAGGMYRERIRSNPNWRGEYARYDTVFIEIDAELPGMQGMVIGRVYLFFSFKFADETFPCALIHWYVPVSDHPDEDSGLWIVRPEYEANRCRSMAVVHLDTIARAAHLIPVYGPSGRPEELNFTHSLDVFRSYYINKWADHHTHEFLE